MRYVFFGDEREFERPWSLLLSSQPRHAEFDLQFFGEQGPAKTSQKRKVSAAACFGAISAHGARGTSYHASIKPLKTRLVGIDMEENAP